MFESVRKLTGLQTIGGDALKMIFLIRSCVIPHDVYEKNFATANSLTL